MAQVNISTMNERLRIREKLNNMDYFRKNPIERVKIETEIMKVFNEGNAISINDSYKSEMDSSIDKITGYIKYLMESYQKDLEEYNENSVLDIRFNEPEPSTVIRRCKDAGSGNQDRANEIIPLCDRMEALKRYPIKYFGKAYSDSSNATLYYCFMYEREDGIPVIILEPSSGAKHTKAVFLDRYVDYSGEDFISLVREYLELSYTDYVNNKRTILHKHINIDKFNEALDLDMTIGSAKCTSKNNNRIRSYKKLGL